MIIIELDKKDMDYAEQICDLAEDSLLVDGPISFNSNLNDVVQLGITLLPSAISSVALIITEIIRNKKPIRIRIGDFEVEGPEKEAFELARTYIEQNHCEKATEEIIKILSSDNERESK